TVLQDMIQDLAEKISVGAADFEIIVWGVLMIVLLQLAPNGLFSFVAKWGTDERMRRASGGSQQRGDVLPSLREPPRSNPILSVRSLSKNFGGLKAVSELSFELQAGEILGLIGPNGAGKSTTFDMIAGVTRPTSGEVILENVSLAKVPLRKISTRGLARTFQHVRLVPNMSVLENTMIGAHLRGRYGILIGSLRLDGAEEDAYREEAKRQLERVGLLELAGERTGNLALGQQRLVEIARALCMDPVVLLLDEPAAGLRFKEKEALAGLMRRLRGEGISVVVIEHDMDFLMNLVDRVVVMNFGVKIAEGKPQEVRTQKDVLDAYLGVAA
ncbi:MAG: ABC transporter ATP-binding protein, partial [Methylocystis sp.]